MQTTWMFLAAPAMALIAACSSDSKKSTPDALRIVDSPVATIDAPPACNISKTDFGDLGTVTNALSTYNAGMATANSPARPVVFLGAGLSSATPPDVIYVEFYSGFTPFGTLAAPTAAVPGTYPLTGEQLQYSSCGVCITAGAKVLQDGSNSGDFMATGGSVKITTNGAAVGGTLAVELSNVTFEEVTFNDMGVSTPVGNGCNTKVTKLIYSGMMVAPSAKPSKPGQRTGVKLVRSSF